MTRTQSWSDQLPKAPRSLRSIGKRGKSAVLGLVGSSSSCWRETKPGERRGLLARTLLFIARGFGFAPFLCGLSDAYGWRYLVAVSAQYGINQGAGMSLLTLSVKFYAFSALGIGSAAWVK